MQSAGGVENDHVAAGLFGLLNRGAADRHRRPFDDFAMRGDFGRVGINRNADLLAKRAKLLDGCRPLQVGGRQQWMMPLAEQELGQLAAGGGFSRTLQARTS